MTEETKTEHNIFRLVISFFEIGCLLMVKILINDDSMNLN